MTDIIEEIDERYTPSSDRAGVRYTINTLDLDGWKMVHVTTTGGEREPVTGLKEALDEIMNLDDAFLIVERDGEQGWVRFVMGNDPVEVVCDYTVNLTVVDSMLDTWGEG